MLFSIVDFVVLLVVTWCWIAGVWMDCCVVWVVGSGLDWCCACWLSLGLRFLDGWFDGTSLLTGVLVCVLDCSCGCIGLVWLCGRLRLV